MRKVKDIKVGDYIFHCCKEFPNMTQGFRVVEIHETLKEIILGICWFDDCSNDTFHYLHISNEYINQEKFPEEYDTTLNEYWYQTEWDVENKGIGKYIYKNAKDFEHREYELVQEHLLFKDIDLEPECFDDEYLEHPNYYWRKNEDLILYKAVYNDCSNGQYFVKHAKDFYENFKRIY